MNPSLRIWRLPAEIFNRFDTTLRRVLLVIGSLCTVLTVIVGFMTFFSELAVWKLYVSIGFTSTLAVIFYLSYIDEFLSQRFFVLFVILAGCCIKLMAQSPVGDYGYIFIYCSPLLSMVFLTPRDTKLIISVNTFVFLLLLIVTVQTNEAGLSALNNALFITHFALFVVLNYALPLSFREMASLDRTASNALIKENETLKARCEKLQRMFNESRQAKAIVNLQNGQLENVNESMKNLLDHAWQSRLFSALQGQRSAMENFEKVTLAIGAKNYRIESDRAYSPDLRTLTFIEETIQKTAPSDAVKQNTSIPNTAPMLDRNDLINSLSMISGANIATFKIEGADYTNHQSVERVESESIQQFIRRLRSSFPASPLARLSRRVFVVVFTDQNSAEIQSQCRQLVNQTFSRQTSAHHTCHVCIAHASGSPDMLHYIIDKSLDLVHKSRNHLAYSYIMDESQHAPVLQQRCKQVAMLIEKKQFKTVFRPFGHALNDLKGFETKTLLDIASNEKHLTDELVRIAKRMGQLATMTFYGLEQLCRTLSNLHQFEGLPDDFLSTIDLTATELQSEAFVHQFLKIINSYEVPPQAVAIAVSERALLEHWEQIRKHIRMLRSFGIRLALRDVSSHEETLSQLANAPVDYILLDSDIVIASLQHSNKNSPLNSISSLCSELNVRIIAQGVECNGEQEDPLHRFGHILRQCRHFEAGLTSTKAIELFQQSIPVQANSQ